jgi:hypothetical protein
MTFKRAIPMLTSCFCGLIISAILLLGKIMANPDELFGDYVPCPDDEFEARLAAEEMQKNSLYEMYTSGPRYAHACVNGLLDNIRFLYGAEVCAQTQLCLNNYLQDESALRAIGGSWNLFSTAESERGRIDILETFHVDMRSILESTPIDCSELTRFLGFEC